MNQTTPAEKDDDVPEQPAAAPRGRRKSGGLTLRDVARVAGVAPITASRALNTPDAVSPKVLRKVRAAVAETGYVPNLLAGALASKKSRLVAAVVPHLSGPVFLETIESLTQTLAAAGYQLMLGQSGYENSREDALLETIIGRRPDGIVLTGAMHTEEVRRKLKGSGIPVVETWDLTGDPIDMLVGFSHEQIGAAVARYMHQAGRRRVATISGDDDRSRRRAAAFVQTAAELGMAQDDGAVPCCFVPAPTTVGGGRIGLGQLLEQGAGIDAIFCSSDMMALGVMIEAAARGISIPGQLALVGFGDIGFARDLQPPLTTVRIDGTAIGRTAAQLIMDRTEGRPVDQPHCDLGFTLVERASV
jgi:LacI family gluconate utilization system Gnt-I transcriptional repressor